MYGPGRRWAVGLVLGTWLCLDGGPALGDVQGAATYHGPFYGASGPGGGLEASTPTGSKGQSKTWWQDGTWWALLYDPKDAALHVAELAPDHTWQLQAPVVVSRPVSVGDVVLDGNQLHVLSRTRAGLVVSTLRFRKTDRVYRSELEGPRTLGVRGTNSATMAQDSTGRLWVSFVRSSRLQVMHSGPDRARWTQPHPPDVPGTRVGTSELSDIVAMDGSVTVVWSDQRRGIFHAATHRDDEPDDAWDATTIVQGDRLADDHVNAHVAKGPSGDTLLVAVKTSRNDLRPPEGQDPLILLLSRDPAGRWSRHVVSTVADGWTRPVVTSDASGQVYVFGRQSGSVRYKEAPLSDLDFEDGPGRLLFTAAGASFTDPSVGTEIGDALTGVLVLVSDDQERRYWHAELAVSGSARGASTADRPDTQPPEPPTRARGVVTDGSVRLSWSPTVDRRAWVPAGEQPPTQYVVLRDGRRVGRTSATSFSLRSHDGRGYRIVAVDLAGNRSQPAQVVLEVRLSDRTSVAKTLLLAGGLVLAVLSILAGVFVHLRRQVRRTASAAQRFLVERPPAPPLFKR